ncbi:hypothetical protein ABTW96_21995 [Nocardia beijingensis]|uniref:hypothetical protein n=1 Tax=Nocardia beijingensis TaxID=95162 RepID=UPI00332D7233
MLPAPILVAPATAERGTTITVHGERWPCDSVRAFPDWSEAVTARIQGGSFDARIDVPDGAELGPHAVPAACLGTFQRIVVKAFVEIVPARLLTTTEEPTSPGSTGARTPKERDEDRDEKVGGGGILGLGAFLLALGAAALALRSRRKSPDEASADEASQLPQVQVRVVAEVPPSIHVRQVTRAPDVRVRLRSCEPWLNVKEVLG